ncbi:MAG: site-specific integrase, partial [Byssovorax sp.]
MTSKSTRRRRGLGTIQTEPGGRKRARLTTTAGRIPIGTFASEEAADVALEAARAELADGAHVRGLTLRKWGARFLDRRELAGFASVGKERSSWRTHVEDSPLAPRLIEAITDLHIIEWAEVLVRKKARGPRGKGQRISRHTAQNALNLLRGAFDQAFRLRVIPSNPALGVTLPAGASPTHEPWTYLTAEELDALLTCREIPRGHLLWISFAIGTGLREGEMFNLHLGDVHAGVLEAKPRIVVRYGSAKRGPKRTRGTRVKIRIVPLFGLALQAIREWMTKLPSHCPRNPLQLVFPGPTGA